MLLLIKNEKTKDLKKGRQKENHLIPNAEIPTARSFIKRTFMFFETFPQTQLLTLATLSQALGLPSVDTHALGHWCAKTLGQLRG